MAANVWKSVIGLKSTDNVATVSNLQRATPRSFLEDHKKVLNRTLSPWQVYFMTFSSVVGIGIFTNGAYALSVAGIGGASLATVIVGLIVFCVVQSMSELLIAFPVANPMAEFVRTFVDKDLAALVEAGYWLVYAAFLNALVVSASNLLGLSTAFNPLVRILITCLWLVIILSINLLPVRIYGHIETILGALKIAVVITILGLASYSASTTPYARSTLKRDSAFGSDGVSTQSNAQAIFSALALAVYSYVGIEAVATTSAEAFNESKVVPLMSTMSPIISVISVLLCVTTGIAVGRQDPSLSRYTWQGFGGFVPLANERPSGLEDVSAIIAAVQQSNLRPKAVNALLVFCAISSANTALYVSSRALFGAIRRHNLRIRKTNWTWDGLGQVSPRTRVPTLAVALAFFSLLWLTIINMVSVSEYWSILQMATNAATGACIMIWASQCIAFLRFNHFRSKFAQELPASLILHKHTGSPIMANLRPYLAGAGLLGCVILYISATAFMWADQKSTMDRRLSIAGVFLPLVTLAVYYLAMKCLWLYDVFVRDESKDLYVHFRDHRSFKSAILALQSQIHPTDYPVRVDSTQPVESQNKLMGSKIPQQTSSVSRLEDTVLFPACSANRMEWQSSGTSKSTTQTSVSSTDSELQPPIDAPIITRRIEGQAFSKIPSASQPLKPHPKRMAKPTVDNLHLDFEISSATNIQFEITPPSR